MTTTRTETDSLGPVEVPASAYWGAQTARAVANFPISGRRMPTAFLHALARIKREAARVNRELGTVRSDVADAIVRAADEVLAGRHDDQFPVDIYQTGSGTSTNMNMNEVLANRAIELLGGTIGSKSPVHPNDHVNAGQSSNDTIPTALHVAALAAVENDLRPSVANLASSLEGKATGWDDIVKIGRTHLQDAVPIRVGQELGAWARQLRNADERLATIRPRLAELALGGTAVGTGLNAPSGFADRVIGRLAEATGLPFVPAPNRFEALAARDAAVETSGALRVLAVSLRKIADDLRWLGSGPRCGLGELVLPSLQPGSSIMPGKVNPVVPESVLMVVARVIGNDQTIAVAGLSGNLQLNVMLPVIADALLESIELLAASCRNLDESCVAGLEVNRERVEELVERSLALCTSLVPRIGYDSAASIAKEAFASDRTVRDVARERGVLPDDELEAALDPRSMTEGGVPGRE